MPHEIRIPRLGWSMEEGTFIGWCRQSGEHVAIGEPLFELEGDKALQEIESVAAGKLYIPPDSPQPGSVVRVGALLGYLCEAGEAVPSVAADQGIAPAGHVPPSHALDSMSVSPPGRGASESATASPGPAGPAVRRLARELGVNLDEVPGTGKSGRITQEDVAERSSSRHDRRMADIRQSPAGAALAAGNPIASPRARRVATELGVDWTVLHGTGRAGRIREADVRAAAATGPGSISPAGPGLPASSAIILSTRRKSIADRLRISRERTIPVTLTTTVDATNLVGLREQFKSAQAGIVPAYTDIVACLVARVLKRHPQIAVRWDHDHRSLIPVADDQFHIGIAVDTPDGLLVPVVRDVTRKSLTSFAEESRLLIDRARAGRLASAEMQGGVFTITNLGTFSIDWFTPIINYPEIAILGLGALRREPAVMPDDRIVARHCMTLSLTFDHAAIDGAPAAAFLRDIAGTMENPAAHLLTA